MGLMRFNTRFIAIAGALAVLLAACGGTTPAATSAPATAAAATNDPFTAQWNDLIAAAKQEGQLNIVGGPEGSQADGGWYDAFGKQFGIKIVFSGGNAADVKARVLAERAQGVYTVDISGQGGTGTQGFVDAKLIQPITPLLINPEVLDRSKNYYVNQPIWSDPTHQFCQYVALDANVNAAEFYYNTQKVSQAEIDSVKGWKDLLDPKWKGRIVIGDIASGEASTDRGRLWLILGQSWFDTLLRTQQPKVVAYGDERTYADGVARGDFQIALFPPGTASLQAAIKSKLPVANMLRTMAEGVPHTGSQRMCVMDHPAHPNAAKLYANWMLMKDGQTALNAFTQRVDRVALRTDAPKGVLPDDLFARANAKPFIFLDESAPEYQKALSDSAAFVKAAFTELKIVPGK
jgi:iron(III) transport system substrate-binding protein